MRPTGYYWLFVGCVLVLNSVGCNNQAPQFTPDRMAMVEAELVDEHQQQIHSALETLFGTPDEPLVPEGVELDLELLQMAAGQAGYVKHADGEEYLQRGLYRQHCASCHGITGDGRGLAAAVMEPYPRDFRPGVFKWKSTRLASKPLQDDLKRVIEYGLPGTSMPSFELLDDGQIAALAEYVRYLAIRGEVERELVAIVADELDFDPTDGTTNDPFDPDNDDIDQEIVDEVLANVEGSWQRATGQIVEPDPLATPDEDRTKEQIAQSADAGRELFASAIAKCTDCHGHDGGSPVVKDYDDWNQAVFDFRQKTAVLAAQVDRDAENLRSLDPSQAKFARDRLAAARRQLVARQQVAAELLTPQMARPRDLADGVFRGGSEPIDLFRRIHTGVAGTPMPGQGSPRPSVAGALSEEEIWQLVEFVHGYSQYVE